MTQRLRLQSVTLCCIDTRSPDLALHALGLCLSRAEFDDVVFIGPEGWRPDRALHPAIRFVSIPPLRGIDAYSDFVLKHLGAYVNTTHALVTQWDGFILNPELWRQEFLQFDYIGAPWYHGGHPGMVGNGGFSLRSKRLLDALGQINLPSGEPEDVVICVTLRKQLEQQHRIRFAPLDIAQAFACEYGTWRDAFGFHGMHNFAHVMTDQALHEWLSNAPDDILTSQHARKLIKELMRSGRATTAMKLVFQRSRSTGWTTDQCVLLLRAILRWRPRKVAYGPRPTDPH